ncbi:MAG: thioredoxin family protein [Bacteroidetes bacterium]|nr:thioredoxin family protein [Bacteroidota bacterium]
MELMTKTSETREIVQESLSKAISYADYRALVANHVENGTSTGPNQTEALTNYTLLNHSRMKRLDKTVRISETIQEKFENFRGNHTWLIITESWCGDAAQTMPAMNKLAELTPNIDFKVVQRDEHLDLMNAFLTNGAMSIPKLVVIDNNSQEIIADWGPRPTVATKMVADYKEAHGKLTPEFKQDLQVWYNKDKSQNTLQDLARLID